METLLTIAELAGVLKLAEQTIRKWVLNRQIPFLKIGKVIRFKPSQIEKWVDSGGLAACVACDLGDDTANVEIDAGELFAETDGGETTQAGDLSVTENREMV